MTETGFYLVDLDLGLKLYSDLKGVTVEKEYYSNGVLKHHAYYLEKKLHGPSRFYSEQGTLLSESWFFLDQRQGRTTRFYSSAKLYCIERYKGDQYEGMQVYFYEEGHIKTELPYFKGKLHGEVKLFWPNKGLKRRCQFSNGKKLELDQMWDEHGNELCTRAAAAALS